MSVTVSNLVITGATTPGGNGRVVFDVATSTGVFSAALTQNNQNVNNTGGNTPAVGVVLESFVGELELLVTDLAVGGETAVLRITVPAYVPPPVLGCTDPTANNYDPAATQDDGTCAYTPPPRTPYFVVSPAQSLRFVQPGFDPDDADQVLLADQRPLNINNPGYCQRIAQADTAVVQWRTNYTTGSLLLVPAQGGPAVRTIAPVRVVQGAGVSADFDVYARLDAPTGGSRIYFNAEALPLPFLPGARITLAGAAGLAGTFPVADVREDPAAAVPYLLLSAPYPSGAQRIDLTLTTPYALQAFDTWQAVLPFTGVPPGAYQAHIVLDDSEFAVALAVSEPLDVAAVHADTVLVTYRNFDNAFGLHYSAGLVNQVRVVGRLFERETTTQKTTLRGSDGTLTLLTGQPQRLLTLTTFLQADWMHEKLAVAFCHDFVRVNGLRGVVEGGYEYPATPGYALSNGTAQIEQTDFLGAGNRDDVGDVDGGPFLLVNQQFLQVNR